jgi:hypothetical protein
MGYIYISYSRKDTDTARKLQAALQARGYSIWIDYQDLNPGSVWAGQIDQAIRAAEIFVVLLSPSAVESRTIQNETALAEKLQKPIIPVLIERTAIPGSLANRQFIDATGDWEQSLAKLAQAIEASLHLPPARRLQAAPPVPAMPPPAPMARRAGTRIPLLAALIIVALLVIILIVVVGLGSGFASPTGDVASSQDTQEAQTRISQGVSQTAAVEQTGAASGERTGTPTPPATATAEAMPSATRGGSVLTLTDEAGSPSSTPASQGSLSSVQLTATALAEDISASDGPTPTFESIGTSEALIPTALPETGGGGGKFVFETVVAEVVQETSVAFQATEQSVLSPAEAAQLAALRTNDNSGVILFTGLLAALAVGISFGVLVVVWSTRDMRFRRSTAHPTAHPQQTAQPENTTPDKLLEEYQLFISCSDRDKEWVDILVEDLEALNYLVWWYVKDAPGLPFGNEIRSAIFHTKVFLIVLSPDSMKSKHVEEEIRWAEIYDRPIIPVLHRVIAVEERLYGLAKGADIDFSEEQGYKNALELLTQAIDHYLKQRLEQVTGT